MVGNTYLDEFRYEGKDLKRMRWKKKYTDARKITIVLMDAKPFVELDAL